MKASESEITEASGSESIGYDDSAARDEACADDIDDFDLDFNDPSDGYSDDDDGSVGGGDDEEYDIAADVGSDCDRIGMDNENAMVEAEDVLDQSIFTMILRINFFLVCNYFPWELGDGCESSGTDSSSSNAELSDNIQAAYYDDDIVGLGSRYSHPSLDDDIYLI